MRLKAAFKFEIREFLTTVLSVYGVMMLINLLGIAAQKLSWGNVKTNMTLNGAEIILIVTVFIIAAGGFGEDFQMLIQNGVSRKNIFKSKLCAAMLFAVVLSAADRLFLLLTKLTAYIAGVEKSTESIWNQVYPGFADGHSAVITFISMAVLSLAVYLFAYMLGTAISGLIYRLSKRGRTALAIGLPVTAFVIIPLILEYFWDTAVVRWLIAALAAATGYAKGLPYPAIISFAVLACIFGAASWAILRGAVPKE